MSKKFDLPAMPFYVGDWLKCPEVRALQPDYRGLWFDLICFMWESTERGVMVKPNGDPYSDAAIIRMVGLDNQNTGIWLTHLLDNGVCCRRHDGAIYSKRMIKDEELRVLRREIGKKGGNPTLLVNHTLKTEVNQIIENENEYENAVKDTIKTKNTTAAPKPKKQPTFVRDNPPTLEECTPYCKEKGIDPQQFHDANTAVGWVDKNKTPYRDWKAVVRKWANYRSATTIPIATMAPVKRPVAIVILEQIAAGKTDHDIMHALVGTYSEHSINEALMQARGKVQ